MDVTRIVRALRDLVEEIEEDTKDDGNPFRLPWHVGPVFHEIRDCDDGYVLQCMDDGDKQLMEFIVNSCNAGFKS